jgi:prephenate dehydrogenase
MKTVAIFGVGLIGGSFALALRRAGFTGTILGVSSLDTIDRALELKVIDESASAEEAARRADLIYLAQPIFRIIECIRELNTWVKPQALITDAGSTKQNIVQCAAEAITGCQFLGGHPLAGREKRGVEAAEAVLFEGRPYVLTPRSPLELDTLQAREFIGWIERIGGRPLILSPEEHDRVVAYTSHLPQLASTALAALLDGRDEPRSGVFGPALVDSTRLAMSSFDVWGDILNTNASPIHEALEAYIAKLQAISRELGPIAMREEFLRAARLAAQLREV